VFARRMATVPPFAQRLLRQMLTEAVRNTKPSPDHEPKRSAKAKKIAAGAACVD